MNSHHSKPFNKSIPYRFPAVQQQRLIKLRIVCQGNRMKDGLLWRIWCALCVLWGWSRIAFCEVFILPPAHHSATATDEVNENIFVFSAHVESASTCLTQKADIRHNFSYHIGQTRMRHRDRGVKKGTCGRVLKTAFIHMKIEMKSSNDILMKAHENWQKQWA